MSACKGLRRGEVRPSLSSVRCTACPAGLRLQASSLGPFAGWARPGICARVGVACLLWVLASAVGFSVVGFPVVRPFALLL